MYIPAPFKQQDLTAVQAVINAYPLATLCYTCDAGLDACAIPLSAKRTGSKLTLVGHVAAANSIHRRVKNNAQVLVTFTGPNHYISPAWYPAKQKNAAVVPTWNYLQVQIKGCLQFNNETAFKRKLVSELTDKHEQAQAEPWQLNHAPEAFINRMLKAIVGLEIRCDDIQAAFKLGQNRTDEDRNSVKQHLQSLNHPLADWM